MKEYRHHINVTGPSYVVQYEKWSQGGPTESIYDSRTGRRVARCALREDAERIVRALELLDAQESTSDG